MQRSLSPQDSATQRDDAKHQWFERDSNTQSHYPSGPNQRLRMHATVIMFHGKDENISPLLLQPVVTSIYLSNLNIENWS